MVNVKDLSIESGNGFVNVNDGKLLVAILVQNPVYSFEWLTEKIFSAGVRVHTRLCAGVELGLEAKLEKSVSIPSPLGFDVDLGAGPKPKARDRENHRGMRVMD